VAVLKIFSDSEDLLNKKDYPRLHGPQNRDYARIAPIRELIFAYYPKHDLLS
jgi:hypothetical protein